MVKRQLFSKIFVLAMVLISLSCSKEKGVNYVQNILKEAPIKDIIENRDMTRYEQGGQFYCNSWLRKEMNADKLGEKKVCDFILEHLSEKKRGYVKFTCNGIDMNNTEHIFIEPNEKGEWKIKVRYSYQSSNPNFFYDGNVPESENNSVTCIKDESQDGEIRLYFRQ